LIFQKITKIVANRYDLVRLKCTKFNFDWGSGWESLTTIPQTPLAECEESLLPRKEKGRRKEKRERRGEG